jgi:hypothetical protein
MSPFAIPILDQSFRACVLGACSTVTEPLLVVGVPLLLTVSDDMCETPLAHCEGRDDAARRPN